MKDGGKQIVTLGTTADSNRWIKKSGSDEIWSVSSWAGDWATAGEDKFQKTEEKKDDKGDKKDDKDKKKEKKSSSISVPHG